MISRMGKVSLLDSWVISVTPTYFLEGTDVADSLYGTQYADTIYGRDGHDLISGGAGADNLFGEIGNDTLYGGTGDDKLDGGSEDDTLVGGMGADKLIGGEGFDTASYVTSTYGVSIDLASGGGLTNDAQGDTYFGIEKFVGSNRGDYMNGDGNDNNFDGAAGDDWLFGNAGHDTLAGNAGNDYLSGGIGDDVLNGGADLNVLTGDDPGIYNSDTFVINWNGHAEITDYDHRFDHLAFSGFGSQPFGSDNRLATGYFEPGLLGGWRTDNLDSTDRVFYDIPNNRLVQMTPELAEYMKSGKAITSDAFHEVAEFTNDAYISRTDLHVI